MIKIKETLIMNLVSNITEERLTDSKTGISIVPSRDNRMQDFAKKLITDYYLKDGESIQEGLARASFAWCGKKPELAQRIYDAVSQGWFMFASPVLSNAPESIDKENFVFKKQKSLPISCFGSDVDDSLSGLIGNSTETRWLSVKGGGVGVNISKIRSAGLMTPGPIPFICTYDTDMEAYKQGAVRRGSVAIYMDDDHPDLLEFLNLRVPTGDTSRKCHSAGFHNAVNISDAFMQAVQSNSDWNLIDPHDKTVKKTVSARKLWDQILDVRYRTGEPYLHFIDTSNRALPWAQKELGLRINNTNLCSEIFLPNGIDRTFVCCLSSLNVELFDEWKNTTLVQDLVEMLDNVLDYFIEIAPSEIEKAKYSAMRERAIGLGVMGFHYYLQRHGVPFESSKARTLNKKLFSHIHSKSVEATKALGIERGECPDFVRDLTFTLYDGTKLTISSSDMVQKNDAHNAISSEIVLKRAFQIVPGDKIIHNGISGTVELISGKHPNTGWRNASLEAIAPTANSAILCGTSPSIEPSNSNAYIHQTRAGSWPVKNRYLEKLLEEKGLNTQEVWNDIISSKGSILHMDIFTDEEKNIFKTSIELNQMWVIRHAADRGPFITQGQSVNLFFPPRCDRNYFSNVHREAWRLGLKSLYYVRTATPNRADNVSQKLERIALKGDDDDSGDCLACHG